MALALFNNYIFDLKHNKGAQSNRYMLLFG